jgi:hypothetical protein
MLRKKLMNYYFNTLIMTVFIFSTTEFRAAAGGPADIALSSLSAARYTTLDSAPALVRSAARSRRNLCAKICALAIAAAGVVTGGFFGIKSLQTETPPAPLYDYHRMGIRLECNDFTAACQDFHRHELCPIPFAETPSIQKTLKDICPAGKNSRIYYYGGYVTERPDPCLPPATALADLNATCGTGPGPFTATKKRYNAVMKKFKVARRPKK